MRAKPADVAGGEAEGAEALAKGGLKIVRTGIVAPIGGAGGHDVAEDFALELDRGDPAPADGGVHDLEQASVATPGDDEVRDPVGQADDDNCGQGLGGREEQMIGRQHDLLGFETELVGDRFHGVDRSAVDAGLAGLAQAAIAGRRPKAFEQAFERGGPAVHVGALDHFGCQKFSQCAPARAPAERSKRAAGETRSTATSTEPGRPCCSGMRDSVAGESASSTRTLPSRISAATRETSAEMVPYCAQGKPSRRTVARCPGCILPSAAAGANSATICILPAGKMTPSCWPSVICE